MGDKVEIILEERQEQGKKLKALRKSGYIPAVVYGHDFAVQSVKAPHILLTKAYRSAGKHQPVELQLSGKKRLAIIKTADIDPVKHTLRHVAFHVIKQNEKVQTTVPIVIEGAGETPAEKAGLVVLTAVDTVEVEALPNDLPESLSAPGEKLVETADHLSVADLVVPKGVIILSDPEQTIATVYEPGALQAANDAMAGSGVESVEDIESEHGESTTGDTQAAEDQPGGKKQNQPAKE